MRTPTPSTERGAREPRAAGARRIGIALETAAELAHAMHRDGDAWSLVLVGHEHEHVAIGERALVTLEVRGHAPVEIPVIVMWRRLCRGPGLPAALGLRLERAAPGAIDRLRAIVDGRSETAPEPSTRPRSPFEDDVRDVLRWRMSHRPPPQRS